MQFEEILTQVIALLQSQGRVSYRALKLRFQLDEEYLAGITEELIDARRVARDEDGKVLVWVGATPVASVQLPVPPRPQPPSGGS
jgi:hypothetical protein